MHKDYEMSNEQKTLYILGLIIIAGIITIGSFSLGVYIGKNGWIFDQPSMLNPAQAPKQGNGNPGNIPQGPNQNSPTKPDLTGITISISSNNIELNTKHGIRSLSITDHTVFLKQENGRVKPVDSSILTVGQPLAVTGVFDQNSRTLSAEIVVILQSKK
jgi:hypothetical protein